MYIPAEAVYYQLVSQEHHDGLAYALSHRVVPTSPGHVYAFLSSVAALYSGLALAGSSTGELTRTIMTGLNELSETTERLGRFHDRMDGSVRSLSTAFDRAKREVAQVRQQLDKMREPLIPGDNGAAEAPVDTATCRQKEVENPE